MYWVSFMWQTLCTGGYVSPPRSGLLDQLRCFQQQITENSTYCGLNKDIYLTWSSEGGLLQSWLIQWLNHIIKDSDVFNFYVLPPLGFGVSPHVIIPPLGQQLVQVSLLDEAMSRRGPVLVVSPGLRGRESFPVAPCPCTSHWPEGGHLPNPQILLKQEKEITIIEIKQRRRNST